MYPLPERNWPVLPERQPQWSEVRKDAEAFREFTESILQHIDEVFFWSDPGSLRPLFVSQSYERIWGYPCGSVYEERCSWLDSIHPEDRERAEQALALPAGASVEYRIVRADGETRWIWTRTFPAKNSPHGAMRIIGIAQDYTERKIAERTHAFLASIVESSEDSIVGTDLDGRIVSWNWGAEKMFGYTAAEALGQIVTMIMPPDSANALRVIDRIRRQERVQRFETVRVAKSGRQIDVSVIISPIRDAAGRLLGVSGIYNDMTERRRAEAEIKRLNDQLKKENSRMSAELEINQRLQQMMLPREEDLRGIPNVEIAGFMQPAAEVGGDYYDVIPTSEGVVLTIGDVTGHGLESGVIAIMVQTAVRTLLASGLHDSGRFFEVLNRVVYDNARRMQCDRNLTFSLLRYKEGMVTVSGQHEEVLVVRANGAMERIDTLNLGFPLGLERDISRFVGDAQVPLQSGEVMAAYTDGITEAVNSAGMTYGLERLAEALRTHHDKPAEGIREAVLKDLREFIGARHLLDDISLLIVKPK
jgi:sigma-B regulation protein RsbU (phosphoserine phosphatase)